MHVRLAILETVAYKASLQDTRECLRAYETRTTIAPGSSSTPLITLGSNALGASANGSTLLNLGQICPSSAALFTASNACLQSSPVSTPTHSYPMFFLSFLKNARFRLLKW